MEAHESLEQAYGTSLSARTSCQLLAAAATFWFALFLAALISEALLPGSQTPVRNFTLSVCCLLLALMWASAASIVCKTKVNLKLTRPDLGALSILAGGAAISVELAIRLLASSHFGGRASAFDFGVKHNVSGDLEHSVAFTPTFNTFGHFIQGCLSLFLFPTALLQLSFMANSSQKLRALLRVLLDVISAWVVAYPVYNIIKRAMLHGQTFASSSFANNAAEWAMGFAFGLSTNLMCTAAPTARKTDDHASTAQAERLTVVQQVVQGYRVLCGSLLCVTSVVAAVLFGVSWDRVFTGEHYTSATDTAMTVVMVVASLSMMATVVLVARPLSCCANACGPGKSGRNCEGACQKAEGNYAMAI